MPWLTSRLITPAVIVSLVLTLLALLLHLVGLVAFVVSQDRAVPFVISAWAWLLSGVATLCVWTLVSKRNRALAAHRDDFVNEMLLAIFVGLEQKRSRMGLPGRISPPPQPYGVSHTGAEQLCAEWMRFYGALDAAVTRQSGDGGIDVVSEGFIAQVKNYTNAVAIDEIRALAGVSSVDGRRPLFFTSGRYPSSAIDFADATGMALFRYDAPAGALHAINGVAVRLMRDGLHA